VALGQTDATEKVKTQKLNVKDTDFLLKVLLRAKYDGTEISQAYGLMKKLTDIHRRNLEN
tara:strand:- start:507 stop:686 length:180 start_codon:yes stop_codon:yes gene_type:complete